MQPLCRGARRRRWNRETVQPWKSTAHKGAPRNWRLNAQVDCFPVFTLGLSLCDDHIVAETREILAGGIEGHYYPTRSRCINPLATSCRSGPPRGPPTPNPTIYPESLPNVGVCA